MAYGASLTNSSGIVQIDQDYSNYYLVASGTAVTSTSPGNFLQNIGNPIYFPVQPVEPIIFIRYASASIVVFVCGITTSSFCAFAQDSTTGVNYAVTFEYRIYSIPAIVNTKVGYGIQVFNSSGNTVYNSANTHMKVGIVTSISVLTNNYFDSGINNPWMLINNTSSCIGVHQVASNVSGAFAIGVRSVGSLVYANTVILFTGAGVFNSAMLANIVYMTLKD